MLLEIGTITIGNITRARKFGERMNGSDCLNLNSELWLYREDLSSRWYIMLVFAFLYLIIIAAGIIGNSCVILAITRNKSLQTVPNLFILSLSCSDIVVCCTSATITPITAFKKEWIFGEALCRIAPFIAGISLCFSTFTLTAISIDRYILIRFPMRKPITHYQAVGVIAIICAFAATITSPIMFKQKLGEFENFCGQYCTENWGANESQRKIYGAALMFLQLVIPLTIIIISYTAISLKIGQSMILKGAKKQKTDNWEMELSDQQRIAVKRRQRTNRMLIGMVVAFACSWIWSVTFNILRDYEYLPELIKTQEYIFGIATHCIAMTSTVWNPLLYAVLNLQLRAAFIDLMPHWLRRHLNLEGDNSSPLLNHPTMTITNKPSKQHTLIPAMDNHTCQQV
ncbi:G-protein coupled receptors family 1 profile domain-containing protein [Caenorhabditis elegans]|uniref:G-protein coupled receptors family 1 profile domain-containing protein n=2 Tax=Caenorhabditis elegans TaxID=6239 RepID=A0A078BS36_CAEEL|nr:G-protein coupled receptors family 1 profile domain-containing protein [Caenorhabditis elegans]CDX47441.1 G-protein coupled receptors family 1 profile domain-containing protein [Caenorhabditis elegans]|eukprot:NP_001294803.1 NeuroPeptide Receptor family [Caenorhabditis elegans]